MKAVTWLAAIAGFVNLCVALFLLPYSPGFDDRTLFAAIYAYTHYGRLFYPVYDMPLMYMHPPTKYWLIGVLMTSGLSQRIAAAALVLCAYAVAVAGIFACKVTPFQRLALLFALSTTITLCPFVSTGPENLTHGEIIGRLRPEDLMVLCWFGGLVWLEASRRADWSPLYAAIGSASIAFAAVTHYPGLPGLAAIAVFAFAAVRDRGRFEWRRLWPFALGTAVVVIPVLVAVRPYLPTIARMIADQNGETSDRGFAATWARHAGDQWLLFEWMKIHAGNTWAALALLVVPVAARIPPILFAGAVLLAFRATRVLAIAALWLPAAVVMAAHKWIGYELPELALFFLACGWIAATVFERIGNRAARVAAAALMVLPLLTASPLVAEPHALRFMDDRLSPERLRAMGRSIVGAGASMYASVYTGGEDKSVLSGSPGDEGIDYFAEREFNLAAAPLHDAFAQGRLAVAGFIFAPAMPSASVLYWSARGDSKPPVGFWVADDGVRRFTTSGAGWQMEMLMCRATAAELPWIDPVPPVHVSGYIPRTNHCVNRELRTRGYETATSTMFFRRTTTSGTIEAQAMVPLLIDDRTAAAMDPSLADSCGCRVLQRTHGGLEPVAADELLNELRRSDRVVRFFANAADLKSDRSMDKRFASGGGQ